MAPTWVVPGLFFYSVEVTILCLMPKFYKSEWSPHSYSHILIRMKWYYWFFRHCVTFLSELFHFITRFSLRFFDVSGDETRKSFLFSVFLAKEKEKYTYWVF